MRIGVAGVGRIGAFHAGTLRDLPVVESVVLADAMPGAVRDVADKLGLEYVENRALCGSEGSIGVGLDDSLAMASAQEGVPWLAGPRTWSFMERFLPAYQAELTASPTSPPVGSRLPAPCTTAGLPRGRDLRAVTA